MKLRDRGVGLGARAQGHGRRGTGAAARAQGHGRREGGVAAGGGGVWARHLDAGEAGLEHAGQTPR